GLIRMLRIVDDQEARDDARQLDAVMARSREAGKAYLRRMRTEWAEKHGPDRLPAFDAFAKRLVRVEKDADAVQEEQQAQARPTYDELVTLSKGWLAVRRQILL